MDWPRVTTTLNWLKLADSTSRIFKTVDFDSATPPFLQHCVQLPEFNVSLDRR
jgi:hypothetical protein